MQQKERTTTEVVKKAKDLYESSIRARVESQHCGEYLFIETDTGAYRIVEQFEDLAKTMLELGPSSSRFLLRIGYPAVFHRGGGRIKPVQSAD